MATQSLKDNEVADMTSMHRVEPDDFEQLYGSCEGATRRSLVQFFEERNLSLLSRLALLEQVCELVAVSHARQVVFDGLSPEGIMVEYVDGHLAIDLGVHRELPGAKGAALVLVPPKFRLSGSALRIALNIHELGRTIQQLTQSVAANLPRLTHIVHRALSVQSLDRFSNAEELLQEFRSLRSALERSTGDEQSADRKATNMRWSWA